MRNKRFFIVLAGALLFGLLAAVSVSRYLSSAQAYTKTSTAWLLPRWRFPVGTKIIPEQLMVVQFPGESTPDGAFDDPQKLAGRVAIMNIAAREPVTEARLAPEGTAGGLSAVIPEGYRAMTVKVDDVVGISGFIMPGTLVDIVVVINPLTPLSRIPSPRSFCRTSRFSPTDRISTNPRISAKRTASRPSPFWSLPNKQRNLPSPPAKESCSW